MFVLCWIVLITIHMCFQKVDRGTDALGRKIDCTNFTIEDFNKCDYVEQIETSTNDLTFVQLNVHGICRGIKRIHRSPSRPRPSMRPTAAFINIHEHLI